jgi:hypothetical protein
MNAEKGAAPQQRRSFPSSDNDQDSGRTDSRNWAEAGQAGSDREPSTTRDQHESIRASFDYSQAALEASQRIRQRGAAAGRRAEELRQWVAATIDDVAAVEERIARIHEGLASESPGSAGGHERFAADARQAVSRARELRDMIQSR